MVITYLGGESFKVQYGDMVIAFNPISKDSKLKASRFGADIVLASSNHPDFNGVDQMEFGEKKPFVITGPGEYEVKGVFIKGFKSSTKYGAGGGEGGGVKMNTIYTLTLENMNLCFLGALGTEEIESETLEALGEIDLLFVPIGGEGVLEPAQANRVAVKLEPKAVIPMHFGDLGVKDALKIFLKEGGEKVEPMDKLTIKKKDLEGKEGDIIVLVPTQ